MTGTDDLAELHANWAAWLTSMATHVAGAETRRFGSIAAASVGAPIPLFNQAFVFAEPSTADLEAAVGWLGSRGVPFWVTVPGHLRETIRRLDTGVRFAEEVDSMPGMMLPSLSSLDADMPTGLDVVAATEPEHLDAVAAATSEAFGAPPEVARMLAPDSVLSDDSTHLVVASIDGESVGCGQLVQTGDIAGVYTIAVPERFRRRGIGEAITRAVLLEGRERGATRGVLQASEMGRPVYDRMGFETFTDYALFTVVNEP